MEGIFCNCCASFVNMLHNIKSLQLRKIWGFNQTRRANLEIMLTFWWLEGFPISWLQQGPPISTSLAETSLGNVQSENYTHCDLWHDWQGPPGTSTSIKWSISRVHLLQNKRALHRCCSPTTGSSLTASWRCWIHWWNMPLVKKVLWISIEITKGWNIPKHLLYRWQTPPMSNNPVMPTYYLIFAVLIALLIDFCSAYCTTDWFSWLRMSPLSSTLMRLGSEQARFIQRCKMVTKIFI